MDETTKHLDIDHPLFLAFAYALRDQAIETYPDTKDRLLFLEYQLEQNMLMKAKYGYPVFNTEELHVPYLESVRVQPWFPKRRSIGYMKEICFRVKLKGVDAVVAINPIFFGCPDFATHVTAYKDMVSAQGVEYVQELVAYYCHDDSGRGESGDADQIAEVISTSLFFGTWKYEPGSVEEYEKYVLEDHRAEEAGVGAFDDEKEDKPYMFPTFNDWKQTR